LKHLGKAEGLDCRLHRISTWEVRYQTCSLLVGLYQFGTDLCLLFKPFEGL